MTVWIYVEIQDSSVGTTALIDDCKYSSTYLIQKHIVMGIYTHLWEHTSRSLIGYLQSTNQRRWNRLHGRSLSVALSDWLSSPPPSTPQSITRRPLATNCTPRLATCLSTSDDLWQGSGSVTVIWACHGLCWYIMSLRDQFGISSYNIYDTVPAFSVQIMSECINIRMWHAQISVTESLTLLHCWDHPLSCLIVSPGSIITSFYVWKIQICKLYVGPFLSYKLKKKIPP